LADKANLGKAGSEIAKTVIKATRHDMNAPKEKHVKSMFYCKLTFNNYQNSLHLPLSQATWKGLS
jgi:hypothetical protein